MSSFNSAESLIERLHKRAEIRRTIPRGEPDRIADLLEEAATRIKELEQIVYYNHEGEGYYK